MKENSIEEDIKILEVENYYLEELGYLRENNHFIKFIKKMKTKKRMMKKDTLTLNPKTMKKICTFLMMKKKRDINTMSFLL